MEGLNVWGDLWGLAKQRISGEIQAKNAESLFGADPRYSVDEYGNAYLKGQPSTTASLAGSLAGVSPLVVIAAVALTAGLLYVALKD